MESVAQLAGIDDQHTNAVIDALARYATINNVQELLLSDCQHVSDSSGVHCHIVETMQRVACSLFQPQTICPLPKSSQPFLTEYSGPSRSGKTFAASKYAVNLLQKDSEARIYFIDMGNATNIAFLLDLVSDLPNDIDPESILNRMMICKTFSLEDIQHAVAKLEDLLELGVNVKLVIWDSLNELGWESEKVDFIIATTLRLMKRLAIHYKFGIIAVNAVEKKLRFQAWTSMLDKRKVFGPADH